MKRLLFIFSLLLFFSHYAYAEIFVEFFSTDVHKYKAVYMSSDGKLIINYFRKKATELDTKYQYAGVEIFSDGVKIKDTFSDND
jgi:hypothetical protein